MLSRDETSTKPSEKLGKVGISPTITYLIHSFILLYPHYIDELMYNKLMKLNPYRYHNFSIPEMKTSKKTVCFVTIMTFFWWFAICIPMRFFFQEIRREELISSRICKLPTTQCSTTYVHVRDTGSRGSVHPSQVIIVTDLLKNISSIVKANSARQSYCQIFRAKLLFLSGSHGGWIRNTNTEFKLLRI